MVYYLLLPFFSIILIVLQTTVSDIMFAGRLVLEISIIVVIYAGFRLPLIKGAISAFVLGFIFDCLVGLVLGFFTLIYVLIFLFSFFVSVKMVAERMRFIALFTLTCAFIEGFAVVLFYKLVYGIDVLSNASYIFFPQVFIVGLLAPLFFYLMRKAEVFLHGYQPQSAERTGTGRIQAEA